MSYKAINCEKYKSARRYTMRYRSLSGVIHHKISIKKGVSVLTAEFTTNAGRLGIEVWNLDTRSCIMRLPLVSSQAFSIALGTGKFMVTLNADDHRGEFNLRW